MSVKGCSGASQRPLSISVYHYHQVYLTIILHTGYYTVSISLWVCDCEFFPASSLRVFSLKRRGWIHCKFLFFVISIPHELDSIIKRHCLDVELFSLVVLHAVYLVVVTVIMRMFDLIDQYSRNILILYSV